MGFWRQKKKKKKKKNAVLKYPKILTFVNPKISIRCKPNISVLFKSPKILTSKSRPWVFLVSKTRFLWNTPRFWQVFYLTFLYTVGPKSLFSLKIPRFWQAKVGHGFFVSKNMVLMKYPKILTYAKPKISIRCKPNIFVLFESLKILTSKSRPWVFWCQKHGSYETPQDFDRCFNWHFDKM